MLFAAAASMGGVGIWSMHFIGNNSLTITLDTGDQYRLAYSTGFTFLSLGVAILTMFLAFAFVGITEEARIGRIVPSGVIAGVSWPLLHDFFFLYIDLDVNLVWYCFNALSWLVLQRVFWGYYMTI